MKEAVLEFNKVSFTYGTEPILQDISFSLAPGEVLGIVGESGAGKSTILKLCLSLKYIGGHHKGQVLFKGRTLFGMEEKEAAALRGRQLAMIFQNAQGSLCPVRRIRTQLLEYAAAHVEWNREQVLERAAELLKLVGFEQPEDILDSYAFQLSGGMNQRLGIVFALLLKPQVILADEPTSALDSDTAREVLHLLHELQRDQGAAMLLVSHDLRTIGEMADKVIVLQQGRIVEQGSCRELLRNPQHPYTKALLRAGGEW